MADDDTQSARDYLLAVVRGDEPGNANRIKAAEAIIRTAGSVALTAPGDVLTASDAELLAAARGEEGGHPPREGPRAPGLSRDPSLAHGEHPEAPSAPGVRATVPGGLGKAISSPSAVTKSDYKPSASHVPRETFRQEGTQKGPGLPGKGTQNEPANLKSIAPSTENGQHPEPWE
jgi:hypothetical protein